MPRHLMDQDETLDLWEHMKTVVKKGENGLWFYDIPGVETDKQAAEVVSEALGFIVTENNLETMRERRFGPLIDKSPQRVARAEQKEIVALRAEVAQLRQEIAALPEVGQPSKALEALCHEVKEIQETLIRAFHALDVLGKRVDRIGTVHGLPLLRPQASTSGV